MVISVTQCSRLIFTHGTENVILSRLDSVAEDIDKEKVSVAQKKIDKLISFVKKRGKANQRNQSNHKRSKKNKKGHNDKTPERGNKKDKRGNNQGKNAGNTKMSVTDSGTIVTLLKKFKRQLK